MSKIKFKTNVYIGEAQDLGTEIVEFTLELGTGVIRSVKSPEEKYAGTFIEDTVKIGLFRVGIKRNDYGEMVVSRKELFTLQNLFLRDRKKKSKV